MEKLCAKSLSCGCVKTFFVEDAVVSYFILQQTFFGSRLVSQGVMLLAASSPLARADPSHCAFHLFLSRRP